MPWYEYQAANGKRVTRHRPVDRRDAPVLVGGDQYRRVQISGRVSVLVGCRPPSQGQSVIAGYRKKEEREGARFKSEFTKEQIKKAWADEI